MTDYLEEHLGSAEALLERIRQLEQSASGLTGEASPKENTDNSDELSEKTRDTEEKSKTVSNNKIEVYDVRSKVNQLKNVVDDLNIDLEIREKEQDTVVNPQAIADDNEKKLRQGETASTAEEMRAQTNVEEMSAHTNVEEMGARTNVEEMGARTNAEEMGARTNAEETGARTNAERAKNRSPLSVQLEELDQAVSTLAALTSAGRESSTYPISLSTPQGTAADPTIPGVPGEIWSTPVMAAGSDLAFGGTQSWAEQADRMFRRDSRRYDGGFYLY